MWDAALILRGAEGAEIIQHTHCCDSSELPEFFTFLHFGIYFGILVLLLHFHFPMSQYTNFCDSSELLDFDTSFDILVT